MGQRWRVGIVGCGVAGLASALLLARRGHEVTLIERAPKLAPVGAGLLLQPSGQLALRRMGLLEQVIARAEPIAGLHAWTHRHRTLVQLSYRKLGSEWIGYGVHRNDLFQVLYDHACRAGTRFHLGTTIAGCRQTAAEIVAVDESGQGHGPFDVLIGADGARSRLRSVPELGARVRELPLGAAWFSGRCDCVRGHLYQVTRGARQLIGMLPLGEGRCSLFCALPCGGARALRDGGFDAIKREILDLCPRAQELVNQINSPNDLATAQYQLVSLRTWSFGRLACIGDAAHSTTPHLGQGVNLALLDALVVANALCNAEDVACALRQATEFRRRQVMWSWHLSNLLGPVFQNEGWLLGMARDIVLPWLPKLPWVGRVMVATMAGLQMGLLSKLDLGDQWYGVRDTLS